MWWALASVYWLLVGLANTTDAYFFRPGLRERAFGDVLSSEMTLNALWIPLTVMIFFLSSRFPLGRGNWQKHAIVHACACAAVVLARALAIYALDPVLGFYDHPPRLGDVVIHSIYNNLFFYWLQAGVAHAVDLSRRERAREVAEAELQADVTRAELHALKAQLHPHFLFNTLHSISALVHDDPDAADRMIARLSDLLRHVLDSGHAQKVSLDDELHCLSPYVEIEKVRFGDRLTIAMDVEPGTRDALVPHLVLQPLVENAVRHGIAPRSAPGRVVVEARRDGALLRLEVRDDGVGLAAGADTGVTRGLGLATTRARLKRLYGADQGLELHANAEGGVSATLTVPFQRRGEGEIDAV
jgi:two-component sensor histidine kinase